MPHLPPLHRETIPTTNPGSAVLAFIDTYYLTATDYVIQWRRWRRGEEEAEVERVRVEVDVRSQESSIDVHVDIKDVPT